VFRDDEEKSAMKARKSVGILSILIGVCLMLSGCLDDKHDRITNFEPGVYKGRADTKLTDTQRKVLLRRAAHQSGMATASGGGGGGGVSAPPVSGSVRMPEDSMALYGRLNARAANQRGP